MVHCGDGSQRLFILEKEGFVRVLTHDMELLKEPFLDIHKLVQSGIKVSESSCLLPLCYQLAGLTMFYILRGVVSDFFSLRSIICK